MELDWEVGENVYGKDKNLFEIWIDSSCIVLSMFWYWLFFCELRCDYFVGRVKIFLICNRAHLVLLGGEDWALGKKWQLHVHNKKSNKHCGK